MALNAHAEPDPDRKPQQDMINDNAIHTVQFTRSGLPSTYPIVTFGEALTLQFDVLGTGKARNFQFTIVHCDADWTVSNMLQSDYIDGMFQDYVQSYSFSTISLKKYVHYKIDMPSSTMRPKVSGNYVLRVYYDDPQKPILQRRFYLFEQSVDMSGAAQRATYSQYRETKHEIDFNVDYKSIPLVDPFREIKVVIKQNWRSDNEITDLKPTYVQGSNLIYDYQEGNLFDAGNEFRPFDIRDFQYKGIGIKFFIRDTVYQAQLFTDEDRSYATYNNIIDQNGGYTIALKQTSSEPTTDADYCYVNFRLAPTYKEDGRDIYVFGALTNWQLDKNFKMTYSSRNGYECQALLKQGFYDYEYVAVNSDGKIDPTLFEGNHWETEDTYTIFVYYRPLNLTGDKLIGVKTLNSTVK